MPPPGDPLLTLAEKVADVAQQLGIQTVLIGAAALAHHNYVRATVDLDLASCVNPYQQLRALKARLDGMGLHTKLNEPDDEDPLGGVLQVREEEDGEAVEIVNFYNPHRPKRNPGADAIAHGVPSDDGRLRIVSLPYLIAMKLYAGGVGDVDDVLRLLESNPTADLASIREVCEKFGLGEMLERVVKRTTRSDTN